MSWYEALIGAGAAVGGAVATLAGVRLTSRAKKHTADAAFAEKVTAEFSGMVKEQGKRIDDLHTKREEDRDACDKRVVAVEKKNAECERRSLECLDKGRVLTASVEKLTARVTMMEHQSDPPASG